MQRTVYCLYNENCTKIHIIVRYEMIFKGRYLEKYFGNTRLIIIADLYQKVSGEDKRFQPDLILQQKRGV